MEIPNHSTAVTAALALLASTGVQAATMSASATAPAANGLDIANYGTVTGNDKWFAESSGAGAAKGQTFRTGTLPVLLKSITYQVTASQQAAPTKQYKIRVGTVSGTTFTQIHTENATQSFQWPGGHYMTWTLDTPVLLAPNTTYGIDVGMTSSTSAWQTGIPYINTTANVYANGSLYNSGTSGLGTATISNGSNDRIFHLELQHPLAPSPDIGAVVPAGDITLSWTNLAPTTGTDVWVDLWYGTDPNALTKVAALQQNLSSFLVNLPGADTYYWRIDSYLDGAPTGSPVQSPVFSFDVFDSDSDGFPDEYELLHTDPPSATALVRENDEDQDGLTNWAEFGTGTSPSDPDSDNDGLLDGSPITVTSADARHALWAADGILYSDNGADRTFRADLTLGSDPLKADSDGDGLSDGVETNSGTWAGPSDTGTHPTNPDSDADGLKDGSETNTGVFVSTVDTGTSPLLPDTDGDGVGDWYEVTASFTNPLSATSKPRVPYPLPDPDASTGVSNKPVKVYIMSGQSNMVGEGTINGTGTNSLETMTRRENKFPNVVDGSGNYIARQDVRYRGVIKALGNGPLAPGFGKSSSFFGPELGFGQIMGWFHDEPVLLIKSSEGNRALGWDILPPGGLSYTHKDSTFPFDEKTYPAYGGSPESWFTASGSEGPGGWYAGKQYDDYFLHEADMGMRPWVSGTAYPNSCQIMHNGVAYISKSAHTAAAASEPGSGGTWSTFWNAYSVTNVVDVLDNFGGQYPQWAAQGFEIAGFVWWQGDRDRGKEGHAIRYEQNLVRLIHSLRSYYSNRYPGKVVPNAPFVLATLGQTPLTAPPSNDKTLLDAMLAVDGDAGNYPSFTGNVKTVYSHPLSEGGASNSHYNQRAGTYMLVGDALGRAMIDLQSTGTTGDYGTWAATYPGADLADPQADLDGDGMTNDDERIFGLDPTSGIAPNPITVPLSATAGTFTYTRRDDALTGKQFTVWTSGDLNSWTEDESAVQTAATPVDGIETVTVTLSPGLTSATKLFVRVVATP